MIDDLRNPERADQPVAGNEIGPGYVNGKMPAVRLHQLLDMADVALGRIAAEMRQEAVPAPPDAGGVQHGHAIGGGCRVGCAVVACGRLMLPPFFVDAGEWPAARVSA